MISFDDLLALRKKVEEAEMKGLPAPYDELLAATLRYEDQQAEGCTDGRHPYAPKICWACGTVYCFSCCGRTNVHEGGKHDKDQMTCPTCGHDYYHNSR